MPRKTLSPELLERRGRRVKPKRTQVDSETAKGLLGLVYPDIWAQNLGLNVDAHPFTTKGREYVIPVMRDLSPRIVIPKAAQTGFTISFLVRTFHWVIQRKWHHLYLLPLKTGTTAFVQGRIDPIVDSNKAIKACFQRTDNRMHKQTAENVNLYIRGTNIWTELREIPVDCEVWDERDKMVEDNLPEAEARMDGSKIKHLVSLSTPTAPGHGVDSEDEWHSSDQHRWWVPCPHCSRYQVLNFKENVKLGDKADEAILECKHCKKKITDAERYVINENGRWEAEDLNGSIRGYHISQLNSPTQPLNRFLLNYYQGQNNVRKLRAFHNNNLGEPFVAEGDQITPEILDKCVLPGHNLGGIPSGCVFLGVDIGNTIHVKASTLNRYGHRMSWGFWNYHSWDQLDKLFSSLLNFVAVVDAHPEKSKAKELGIKYTGKVFMGIELDRPNQTQTAIFHPYKHGDAPKCSIDRTLAFDEVIRTYMQGEVHLPVNARELGENMTKMPYNGYYHQMGQQVRTEEEDAQGRIIARWKKNKNPDHWHHADMFEWVATQHGAPLTIPEDISRAFSQAGSIIGT